MPTSFQPANPHAPAKHNTTGRGARFLTGTLAAVMVMMLVALSLPFLSADTESTWLITVGAGVLTFVLVLASGLLRAARTRRT